MKNLLTSKEFIDQNWNGKPLHPKVKKIMIEFARLHVERALKAASENVELNEDTHSEYQGSLGDENGFLYKDVTTYSVNINSILNSYPLEKIK